MKPTHQRNWRLAAMSGGCAAALLALSLAGFRPLGELERYAQDWLARLGRKTPVDPRLVFLGIDQGSYHDLLAPEEIQGSPRLTELAGNFPWSRAVWAALIEKLCIAGARVVALDLVFAAPGEGDEALRAALERFGAKVVVGSVFSDLTPGQGAGISQTLPDESLLPPPPAPRTAAQDPRVGYVNIWEDEDGVVRQARFRLATSQFLVGRPPVGDPAPAELCESLAARVLARAGHAEAVPPGLAPRPFRFTAPPGLGYPARPLYQVLVPRLWRQNFQAGEFFRGKIVLIGPAANFFHDAHRTPLVAEHAAMLGPEVHLNIIGAALQGEFLSEAGRGGNLLALLWAGFAAWGSFVVFHRPWKRFSAILGLAAGYWLTAQWLFNHAGLVLQTGSPLLALALCSVTGLGYDFLRERGEKNRVRRTLERYVSRNVVREMLDHPQDYFDALGGVRRPVVTLFCDVRGFTALSEAMDSAALVRQLNEYFSEMVEHVLETEGTLDKFIGDAIMGVWGNLRSHSPAADAESAVEAALRMRQSLARLNDRWRAAQRPTLGFGIGLNGGEAVVGNIGYRGRSGERMEFTVVGDAVNLASRLEGLTKEYHLDLLVAENVAALTRDRFHFRTVDLVVVKGKTKPVEVFTVLGRASEPLPPAMRDALAAHEEGVGAWRRREFARAEALFAASLAQQPGDFLAQLYAQRAAELQARPPAPDWDGVFRMTTK